MDEQFVRKEINEKPLTDSRAFTATLYGYTLFGKNYELDGFETWSRSDLALLSADHSKGYKLLSVKDRKKNKFISVTIGKN